MNDPLAPKAAAIEQYVEDHLYDPQGILYSYINVETDRPFERSAITTQHAPVRAHFDPWSYWTYEDSLLSMGLYLDGLARKYEVTGEEACLERAQKLWQSVRKIFSCSQVYGIGNFLRPYGGFAKMGQFAEPLGTDQASPLFAGLFLYSRHADQSTRDQIADVMLKTIGWYETQGFAYFYYKSFIHAWDVGSQHAASYYLPAIAWAAKLTGDKKWRDLLTAKLALFAYPQFQVYRWGQGSFCWGSDLPMLKELIGGDTFAKTFTSSMLESGMRNCLEDLKKYSEPDGTCYQHAEAKEPGFKPFVHPIEPPYARDWGMGFPELYTVHQGRTRPRSEVHFLCGLASLGFSEAIPHVQRLLAVPKRIPQDFTNLAADDLTQVPDTVLAARSVGVMLLEWFRNYWMLRSVVAESRH
jgi:hypothetical protein